MGVYRYYLFTCFSYETDTKKKEFKLRRNKTSASEDNFFSGIYRLDIDFMILKILKITLII